MSDAVVDPPSTGKSPVAHLVRPREEALGFLQGQLKKGAEIKALRIRSGTELDSARAQKLEWTNVTTELLKELFDSTIVSEECNDWVGKIYPEYAEFSNFVEQFYAEMEHRLKRLKNVIKQIQKTPSESRASASAAAAASASAASAAASAAAAAAAVAAAVAPAQAPAGPVQAAPVAAPVKAPPPVPEMVRGLLLIFGGDESTRTVLSDFLDSLDVEITVVDATSANPAALTESLDKCRDASFAMILAGEQQHSDRAFEFGFCVGRLGLKRVCVVHSPGSQVPADPRGLTHVVLDLSGGWQLVLARHLKRAGLGIDLNRLC